MVPQGLIAHGRGEAFDYLLGERTIPSASAAISAAAALLLRAESPVISINGNAAALVGREIVTLASTVSAPIEVNLFHRTPEREKLIARHLKKFGAKEILGMGSATMTIGGISSPRAKVDPDGIGKADVVLIPLEDGDRAQALEDSGKNIISIDLNPLSRTSQVASISIVDNVVRAIPGLIKASRIPYTIVRSTQFVEYLQGWTKN